MFRRKSSEITSWICFITNFLILNQRLTNGQLDCDVTAANDDIQWKDDANSSISITFNWTNKTFVCSTRSTSNPPSECHLALHDVHLATLPPTTHLVLQRGAHIRIDSINNVSSFMYNVDYDSFLNCSVTNASFNIVQQDNQSLSVRYISTYNLKPGANYFIDGASPSHNCGRLLLTVASGYCYGNNGSKDLCNNKGICVANEKNNFQFSCQCCKGYSGDNCHIVASCHGNDCDNDALIAATQQNNSKSCLPGFECRPKGVVSPDGAVSSSNQTADLCTPHTCLHGGSCTTTNSTSLTCFCPSGYTGMYCDVNINDCTSQPCLNGICLDKINGFQCFCTPGFAGDRCEINYDECLSNPCVNGGVCIDDINSFQCRCLIGYSGTLCEVKIDLCTPNPCKNTSVCVDYGHYLACSCYPGFTGVLCEIDINECSSSPCHHGGTCHDFVNSFSCDCPTNYGGLTCEIEDYYSNNGVIDDDAHHKSHAEMRRLRHVRNLYVLVGTLTGAAVLALMVLFVCYCYTYETYKTFFRRRRGYEAHKDRNNTVRVIVEQSSVHQSRPTWESIADAASYGSSAASCSGTHHHENCEHISYSMNTPLVSSLRSKPV